MLRCPKVGDRVVYAGGPVVGWCTGVVRKIYVGHEWDEDKSDGWNARHAPELPESEWHVLMEVDTVPERWAYAPGNTFAPQVKNLKPSTDRRE